MEKFLFYQMKILFQKGEILAVQSRIWNQATNCLLLQRKNQFFFMKFKKKIVN